MTTGSFYYYYNYVEHCKINFLAKLHDIFDRINMQDPAMVGATVVQLWEHSPPTNVARAEIPASTPYMAWVCCWFSPLLKEVFLQGLWYSPLVKNQHFQNPIWSRTSGHILTSSWELLSTWWVNKLHFELQLHMWQPRSFIITFVRRYHLRRTT